MATSLAQVISLARSRHATFHKSRVPDRVVGDFLSDYQNELIGLALGRDRQFLEQHAEIVLAMNPAPAVSGAGIGDGVPGRFEGTDFIAEPADAGALVDAITDPEEGATLLVAEFVAAVVTANTIKKTAAGWTVNAYVGKVVEVTEGPATEARREVISNTADTLTVAPWTDLPVAGQSMARVVDPVFESSGEMGVVTALPARKNTVGYLVKLDAGGNPFIDFTAPRYSEVEQGVTLPEALAYLDGRVFYNTNEDEELTFVSRGSRKNPARWPAAYMLGRTFYLCGSTGDWLDATSIDVRYSPIAPAFEARDDLFLLPDAARPALVAKAGSFMAMRVAGMEGVTVDPGVHAAAAAEAEARYLSTIRLTRSGRRIRFREGEF